MITKPLNVRKTVLPNGFEIAYLKRKEVDFVSDEVQNYIKNGICLKSGDTIFDVGANIGIFSLFAYLQCDQQANIYAFEPIPNIFKVLQYNLALLDEKSVKAIPYGLSSTSREEVFTYYPNSPAMSTSYPKNLTGEELNKMKSSILDNLENSPPFMRPLLKVPSFLRPLVIQIALRRAFIGQRILCRLKTLSEVIEKYNIKQINLLKIDVELGELDVLKGINADDWIKVQQIVLEVHDVNNRVQTITALLSQQGFSNIIIEQEPFRKGSVIYNMYATR